MNGPCGPYRCTSRGAACYRMALLGRAAHLSRQPWCQGATEETGQPRLGDRFGLGRLVEIDTTKGVAGVAKGDRFGRRSTVRTPAHELSTAETKLIPQNGHGS